MPVSIDGRGSGRRGAVLELLELHEDEVPDLDEAVAVLVGAAGGAAGDRGAVVVEDLRAGAAGAGGAHHPEVVVGGDADDPLVGQARDLLPEVGRGVVVVVDGDEEPVRRMPKSRVSSSQAKGMARSLK